MLEHFARPDGILATLEGMSAQELKDQGPFIATELESARDMLRELKNDIAIMDEDCAVAQKLVIDRCNQPAAANDLGD